MQEKIETEIRVENERKKVTKRKKKQKLVLLASVIIVVTVVLITVIIPSMVYKRAERLLADGKYTDASFAFGKLGNYRNAQEMVIRSERKGEENDFLIATGRNWDGQLLIGESGGEMSSPKL